MPRESFSRKHRRVGLPRDNALSGHKILTMNAFWYSFETLLGLGVEPKNLTFIQISLRGVIVLLSHS